MAEQRFQPCLLNQESKGKVKVKWGAQWQHRGGVHLWARWRQRLWLGWACLVLSGQEVLQMDWGSSCCYSYPLFPPSPQVRNRLGGQQALVSTMKVRGRMVEPWSMGKICHSGLDLHLAQGLYPPVKSNNSCNVFCRLFLLNNKKYFKRNLMFESQLCLVLEVTGNLITLWLRFLICKVIIMIVSTL